jgi:aquaporin Z
MPILSELVGTALLILLGLSVVIADFSPGSPIVALVPDPGIRRLITGTLFGTIGGLIALSPVGKISGAHINPVVTMTFWILGKFQAQHALKFVAAQMLGAALGSLPLLFWGPLGAAVDYGATTPGKGYGSFAAMAGEVATTWALIVSLLMFVSHKKLRRFTPFIFPILYAAMVFLEAPVSGTSTNPARSFGPALIAGDWQSWWVYWVGPVLGALIGILSFRISWFRKLEIEVAKVYHFEIDKHGLFSGRLGEE